MKEEEVKQRVIKWLEDERYEIVKVSPKRGRTAKEPKRGRKPLAPEPDIKARKGNAYYFIEAKGDPASANRLYNAVGQLVTKMAAKTPITYAIAISPSYRKFLHLIPPEVQKKFHIKIITVQLEKERSKRLPETIEI